MDVYTYILIHERTFRAWEPHSCEEMQAAFIERYQASDEVVNLDERSFHSRFCIQEKYKFDGLGKNCDKSLNRPVVLK